MKINDIEKLKKKLLQTQSELDGLKQSLIDSAATVVLDQNSVGRLSRMDAMQAQQMAMEAERRRKNSLLKTKAALSRIENDDYGYCVGCDEEIVLGRLSIDPTVIHCIKCCE